MGQSKNGGYQELPTMTPQQQTLLSQILNLGQQNTTGQDSLYNQSQDTLKSFLTGTGFEPIKQAANQNFQQNTLPSILNSFGGGAKSSSALNQALAAGASNLNTNLGSQMAQMQLQAAGQANQQALQPAQMGLNQQSFAYQPKSNPFWQDLLLAGVSGGSKVAAAQIGKGT
jgi:hypothetical protein